MDRHVSCSTAERDKRISRRGAPQRSRARLRKAMREVPGRKACFGFAKPGSKGVGGRQRDLCRVPREFESQLAAVQIADVAEDALESSGENQHREFARPAVMR